MRKLNIVAIVYIVSIVMIVIGVIAVAYNAFVKDVDMDKMVTIEAEDEIGLVYQKDWEEYKPITMMVFHGDSDTEIGRLDWSTGKFDFTGEAEESAKIFFKYFLKPYVDEYIRSELKGKK